MTPTDLPTPAMRHETFSRRHVLRWLIRASYGAFALAFLLPALALRTLRRETQAVAPGDTLVYAADQHAGTPVNANDLEPGTVAQAFPKGKSTSSENLVEIIRLSNDSAEIVAFSAICTHLGCSVLARLNDDGFIPCPCHGSLFDPADDAAVVGGPAGRPLPSLPITVNSDGTIVAQGGFQGEVGPA